MLRKLAVRVVMFCSLVAGTLILTQPAHADTCFDECNPAYQDCLASGAFGCQEIFLDCLCSCRGTC